MNLEVLTPEHEKVMAEHPGLNQRQWWLVSDLTERLAAERARRIKAEEDLQEHKRIMRMHMTNCPNFRYDEVRKTIGQKHLEEDADRAQYPRVEQAQEGKK